MALNPGIFNDYTVRPRNLTQYTAFRGVTDFTQIGQFDQYETGYSFLSVISMPRFLEVAAQQDSEIAQAVFSFKHMLEYEFKGLTGLNNLTAETGEISDGINSINYINRVTMQTNAQVSMTYNEKRGSLITKMTEYYLTGIKDRMTQSKTYHGLIRQGFLEPSLENEVFTLLYYVTDNTRLRLERAILLANAQLTEADMSMYDSQKSDINNREVTVSFNCFPVMSMQVDKAAKTLLEDITGVWVSSQSGAQKYHEQKKEGAANGTESLAGITKPLNIATLDSNNYLYGIMNENDTSGTKIDTLTEAIRNSNITSSSTISSGSNYQ